ncbi:mandelate racemase/muconate lactonizing enzyme family protein [Marinovum sp. 2_MG-2023]|uniref:mandelate racemase/muconate lactonizing enzyme family protein n=1 Tax=unclassified Marinovum TaxID=2647166 RepID=UPI0026E3636B|nr:MULTISPECIES: mandelate racemase/muconate lactonizing enzyme family protein [unclassified Marinovum]MDO6732826.1 mandelate racemase/muconate lactonizing enzyme family protein [Marinovum sp. 2_MG-2023]MDO6782098.1 mandelate racemase/muconate lactonizing enzyme family protein [Marinovum sp. 1_MG-2023]
MKITGLRTYMSRVDDRPRLLVAIDSDAGITGWGEAYNHGPDRALPPILDWLFLQIDGEDPRRVTFLHQKLIQQSRFPPGALGLAAIAAIDHALWDIAAKAAGVPVYQLLGGNVRDRVQVFCGVYTAPEIDEAVAEIERQHAIGGYTAFKLSPYRTSPYQGRWGELCETAGTWFGEMRRRLPSHFEIAFDAHAKITEPIRALQLANALAPYDPMFLEEPLRPEHMPAWGALRSQMSIPLATGESLYNRFEFLALLNAGGVDVIQPDIAVVGGLTEMRRIADLADAHFVTVAPHNPIGPLATAHNVHFAAAQPNFRVLEYRPPLHAPWAKDPYLPVDGHLELRPDRPGWGIEIDETALRVDDYVHSERKVESRPDGSTAYP